MAAKTVHASSHIAGLGGLHVAGLGGKMNLMAGRRTARCELGALLREREGRARRPKGWTRGCKEGHNWTLGLLLLGLNRGTDAQGKACKLDAACRLSCSDGMPDTFHTGYNLTGFASRQNMESWYAALDLDGDMYYLHACGAISAVTCDGVPGMPAALTSFGGAPPHMQADCAACGDWAQQSCAIDTGGASSITCSYPGGFPGERSLTVHYHCAEEYRLPTATQVPCGIFLSYYVLCTHTTQGPAHVVMSSSF